MTAFVIIVAVAVILFVIATSQASTPRPKGRQTVENSDEYSTSGTGEGRSRTWAVGRESGIKSFQASTTRADKRATVPTEPFRWCGRGETVYVRGFEVRDPLTYVGLSDPSERQGYATDPSQIDRSLPVVAAEEAPPLPYWPCYIRMTPEQRHLYLNWLASDRKSLPPDDGYLFVYYYGLERRALVDDADWDLVFVEVQRLRAMHAAQSTTRSRSFRSYSSAFLWFFVATHAAKLHPKHVKALVQSTLNWTEDSLVCCPRNNLTIDGGALCCRHVYSSDSFTG